LLNDVAYHIQLPISTKQFTQRNLLLLYRPLRCQWAEGAQRKPGFGRKMPTPRFVCCADIK
jgi:hypothetical protein